MRSLHAFGIAVTCALMLGLSQRVRSELCTAGICNLQLVNLLPLEKPSQLGNIGFALTASPPYQSDLHLPVCDPS